MNLPKLNPALEYEIVSSIINAVGRSITINYVMSRGICPVCSGQDPFCPTCHGNPTIDIEAQKTVTANIKWKGSDEKRYRPEGQYMDGDCRLNFALDAAGTVEQTDTLLKKALSVVVDNRKCVINRWYYEGSPINRVYLMLSLDEDIGGQRVG